ncbi:MAG: Peptidoglycan/LPS O-acetylase OafA/YrhL, contains acyltransferase and SGNH-hydrolase domain [Mucilaginibacter sp.]|nr:Peptidoglycan/LPS O-acetylase OafA/YrhL, contains acyltransferase and SGNH-hydrolase domain [Mucilaginibacter sp.]
MIYSTAPKKISGGTSIFMDSLRIVAALIVFLGHGYAQWFTTVGYNYNGVDWGHMAVVIFFALSGYVIAYSTTVNNRGLLQYAQARLSRLYSVVIPTLLITALIEIVVKFSDPALLAHYTRGLSWPRYIISGLFLNEVWFLSASPPINGPLWSLSYEFWYYVVFGLFFFRTKGWKGLLLPLAACLIAGPKILLMMPIWLLGNCAYRFKNPIKSHGLSWLLITVMIGIAITLFCVLPGYPLHLGKAPLFFAGQFITDFIIGVFVALALWLMPQYENKEVKKTSPVVNLIRKFADLTFPLYVLHDPMLVLVRSIWKTRLFDGTQFTIAMLIVFTATMLIGYIMEENRKHWTSFFKKVLQKGKTLSLAKANS